MMNGYSLYGITLLTAFGRYLPYMTEEEIIGLLFYGREPDSMAISVWEIKRRASETRLACQFSAAYARMKSKGKMQEMCK